MQKSSIFINTPCFISAVEINKDAYWATQHTNATYTKIIYIRNGQGEFSFEGKNFAAREGDLIIFNPFKRNEGKSSHTDPIAGISICFSNIHIVGKNRGYLTESNPIINLQAEKEGMNYFMNSILYEQRVKSDGYQDIISSLLQAIIIKVYGLLEKTETHTTSSVALVVKKYIEDNYRKELTLDELANHAYVSPYHLAHVFKEEVGIPPIQYMIHCRIEEAKYLLEHSDLPVKEIATIIGYDNANYFNLLFKKITGIPPGKYRKSTILLESFQK